MSERIKVGTLTFHRADNYGAVLQAFALRQALEGLGCDAQVIDYYRKSLDNYYKSQYSYVPAKRRNVVKWCWNLFRNLFVVPARRRKARKCTAFRVKYLHMSQTVQGDADRRETEDKYDVILTGSDQIWSYEILSDKDDWYCFKKQTGHAVVASYAASAGSLTKFKEKFNQYRDDIDAYDAISVRESDLRDYLEHTLGRPVVQVLDPVFLLDRTTWESIAQYPRKDSYVFYYDVEPNPVSRAIAHKVAAEAGLPLVQFDEHRGFLRRDFAMDAGPEEFVGLIRNAACVVTSSFHATAFSVIFHKRFVAALHPTTGARVRSLLESVGLQNRIYESADDFHRFSTDFAGVDDRLDALREKSFDYIRTVLDMAQARKTDTEK